jgi:hypothetical protein
MEQQAMMWARERLMEGRLSNPTGTAVRLGSLLTIVAGEIPWRGAGRCETRRWMN